MADDNLIIVGYTEEGLTVLTYNQIVDRIEQIFKGIYGDDIDLNSNTPDGQVVRLLAEMFADEHDTMRELDSSFNPDTARGAAQDYRYRLNNLWRKNGLYTSIPATFTVNQTTQVAGLDGQTPDEAFAWGITDDTNDFLINSTETFQPGQYTRQFTCTVRDAVNPPVGSITKQIADVNDINITNISNGAPTAIGARDESDIKFAARREESLVNSGMNCCDSITTELLNLPTVVNAKAYEHNYSDYPDGDDADGIPLNTIWVVVNGGSAIEIAKAIYANISGTATKGEQSYTLVSNSGQPLTFNFDYAVTQNIYLKFTLQKLYPTFNIQVDNFKKYISDNTSIDINAAIDSSTMNTIIREAIVSNSEVVQIGAVPINIELSTDGQNWTEYLEGAGKQTKYVLLPENIDVTMVG